MTATAGPRAERDAPRVAATVAVEYALRGDLRFLSHHDELRMLNRALVRAAWPLAYSRGFNPVAQIRVPLPRNLGTAAESQLMLIGLNEMPDVAGLFAALMRQMPARTELRRMAPMANRRAPQAVGVTYRTPLRAGDIAAVRTACAAWPIGQALWVEREMGPSRPARQVDIGPFVQGLKVEDDALWLRLTIVNQATARPTEIFAALHLDVQRYGARVLRTDVEWEPDPFGAETTSEAQSSKGTA